MFGGLALSRATPNTCPTCPAVTVNGLGVASTCACGGAPGACRLKMPTEGPLGSMKVWSPGSTPVATCAGCGAPEKPVTTASPDWRTAGACAWANPMGSTATSSATAASTELRGLLLLGLSAIEEDARPNRARAPAARRKQEKLNLCPPNFALRNRGQRS